MNRYVKKLLNSVKDLSIFDLLYMEFDSLVTIINKNNQKYCGKRLDRILRYSIKHCKYYSQFRANSEVNINNFPLLDKKIIRANYDDILSNKIKYIWKSSAKTGGSTGEPLEIIRSFRLDHYFQNKLWKKYGWKSGDVVLAMDGQNTDGLKMISKYLYKKSHFNRPYGSVGLSSLYLNTDNLKDYVEEFLRVKPSFVKGYPSFIYQVAQYIVNNNISISFKVKAVELTSETALEYQIKTIERAFNTRVLLQYGHTECCIFAYTFDNNLKYVVEPAYGFVEVLDSNGNHVSVGEVGEVVVTTLHNRAMPLIRYRTGDFAEFGGYDKDAKMILNKVYGRTQDVIFDKNKSKILLTALIFAQHNDFFANIQRWQIHQKVIGEIDINIIKSDNYTPENEKSILDLFSHGGLVDVKINYVNEIPKTVRGKSLMIKQEIMD